MKGILDVSAYTAHANLPPGTRTWFMHL